MLHSSPSCTKLPTLLCCVYKDNVALVGFSIFQFTRACNLIISFILIAYQRFLGFRFSSYRPICSVCLSLNLWVHLAWLYSDYIVICDWLVCRLMNVLNRIPLSVHSHAPMVPWQLWWSQVWPNSHHRFGQSWGSEEIYAAKFKEGIGTWKLVSLCSWSLGNVELSR